MGAALLSTPDILLNILRALLDQIPLPISCKIRLLPTQPETIYLASRILGTGVRNLTVHCRTRDMRPGDKAMWERLGDIVKLGEERGLPVICNGDGDGWPNREKIRQMTGASSIMLARAAERNPSVFASTGLVCNITEVVPRLLRLARYIDNPWGNTKFLLNQFKPTSVSKARRKEYQEIISRSKTLEEVSEKLGISLDGGGEIIKEIGLVLGKERGSVDETLRKNNSVLSDTVSIAEPARNSSNV